MSLKAEYSKYYRTMVQSFVDEVCGQFPVERFERIPQLFLPAWGKNYENALTRIVFVGRDTLGWGSMPEMVEAVREKAWTKVFDIREFQNLDYVEWGARNRYTFWGFILYFLAWMYGVKDWEVLKAKEHRDILSSFAWGNANSIERWSSKTFARLELSPKQWAELSEAYSVVKAASEKFDNIEHLKTLLNPDVVFVMCEVTDCRRYLGDYFTQNELKEERIPEANLRVFKIGEMLVVNIPHPQGIMYRSDSHKADYFVKKLKRLLLKYGKTLTLRGKDEFVADANLAERFLNTFVKKLDPDVLSTREATAEIAVELRKQGARMTVDMLCRILNKAGFRTNYGNGGEYKAGRGSYCMLSKFYHAYEDSNRGEIAEAIAEAFTRRDGTYAYER